MICRERGYTLTPQNKSTKSIEKDFIFQNGNTYTLQNGFTLIYTQLLQAVINLISKTNMASEKVTDLTAYSSIKTTDTYHVVDHGYLARPRWFFLQGYLGYH
jgi:hypothetical protein